MSTTSDPDSVNPDGTEIIDIADIIRGLNLENIMVTKAVPVVTTAASAAPSTGPPVGPKVTDYVIYLAWAMGCLGAAVIVVCLIFLLQPSTPPSTASIDSVPPALPQKVEDVHKAEFGRRKHLQANLVAQRNRLGRDLTRRFSRRLWASDAAERKAMLSDLDTLQALARQTNDAESEEWKSTARIAYRKVAAARP